MFDKISNNYCGKAEEGETAMFEIAGLMVSGISLLNDLMSTSRDLKSWEEKDLLVDQEWLGLAIKNGRVTGAMESFCWAKEKKVPTMELKGTGQVVIAHNDAKKILYRIVDGHPGNRNILMKKTMTGS
jgi:hypothetical protein